MTFLLTRRQRPLAEVRQVARETPIALKALCHLPELIGYPRRRNQCSGRKELHRRAGAPDTVLLHSRAHAGPAIRAPRSELHATRAILHVRHRGGVPPRRPGHARLRVDPAGPDRRPARPRSASRSRPSSSAPRSRSAPASARTSQRRARNWPICAERSQRLPASMGWRRSPPRRTRSPTARRSRPRRRPATRRWRATSPASAAASPSAACTCTSASTTTSCAST